MLSNWRRLFESHILQRGYDIYYQGHVSLVEKNSLQAFFKVRGKKDYQVKIKFNQNQPEMFFCNCPYAKAGHFCKHEAAALLYLENEKMPLQTYFASAQEIVAMMDEKMKNEILVKLLSKDYHLLSEANDYFRDVQDQYSSVSLILNGIFMNYGYLNDEEAFEKQLIEFMHQHIAASANPKHALAFLKHLLSRLLVLEDHRFYQVENEALLCLEELVNIDELQKDIFDFLLSDSQTELYLDFLYDHFRTEPYLSIKRELIDQLINKTKAFDAWAKDYYLEYYTLKKLQVLYDQNDQTEMKKITSSFWHFPKIREFWIEQSIVSKKYQRAIEIIQESKTIDIHQPAFILKYDRQLLDLYELTNHPLYFSSLKEMLFNTDPGDFDNYLRFKKLCTPEEWDEYSKILLKTPMSTERLLEILLAEKHYKALFELVLKDENIYFLDRNRAVFLRECPDLLLDCYIKLVWQLTKQAASREEYQQIARLLKKITILENGKTKADELKMQLKKQYPRKRTLHEEIDKI